MVAVAVYTIGLAVLAVLLSFLAVSVWRRWEAYAHQEETRRRAIEREHPATGFDASSVALQISRVREDHASFARQRRPDPHRQAIAFASARRMVVGLAYFRHRDESGLLIDDA